ncbi:hypothetical protein FHX72_000990 [Pseudoclavibacter helvolus]|uniref:Uncharacterized protein n=1 Tax=Pseudoclavibacter helvolus TaxID=255205 RepID=A0A7W4UMG8_9MICO|nr:hypothetical protein [Pseudoclavibacter helvolus]
MIGQAYGVATAQLWQALGPAARRIDSKCLARRVYA